MAKVEITLKIRPAAPDTDLKKVQVGSEKLIVEFGGKVRSVDIRPMAFGLNELLIMFIVDESKGGTDLLEEKIGSLEGVNSVVVDMVTRALG